MLSGTRLAGGARTDSTDDRDRAPSRLYRNQHDGTFKDVTVRAGLTKIGWASSVCAGDYDNDGFIDLFVTYYGANVLYHNLGNGRFEDATAKAGLRRAGRDGAPAARSSITTATDSSICSSRTT